MAGNWTRIESKWQDRWYSEKINESNPDSRPKFMIIFAYPGVTGYLHVGHMRGYTYVDAIARYKRMTGYNVLFPVGTHATGNGAISLAKRVRNLDSPTIEYLLYNGCPEDKLADLQDAGKVVEFFNQVYLNDYWRRFGFLADWRRFTSTVYPEYGKFIQWQFKKLMQKGLLIQKPYFAPACLNCGPVAIDASETDLQKGGHAETNEYTLLKFKCDSLFLVAATLRPETVFGQTNFWINPNVTYAKVRNGDETWVISKEAFGKLEHQKDGLEVVGEVSGRSLVGAKCIAPVIHREIMVLPASFCDPNVGTGLVTSVPSDAPDDYIALKNLQDDAAAMAEYGLNPDEVMSITPIPIIETKGWGPLPAVEIVENMGIERSGDERLDEAKKEIYKAGFHTGRMNGNCREFAGMQVSVAKEKIRDMMIASGEADVFYDLSEEVICRCGGKVVIRKVPDQWFIDYGNPDLTKASKEHSRSMQIMPQEYYDNILGVLDWFRERACVRQGNWLGTRFPFDEKWIIEAISDSTLYPAYYLISHFASSGRIRAEQMTEDVLDFVYLGRGDPASLAAGVGLDTSILVDMRREVEYWYPLDINLGGKEHMTVHFPAFLMNHVAILEKQHWPKGIFVNWYVIGKGGKISKSKGGAQPIPGAAERFGVDAMRLYYAHIASPFADVEWEEEAVENYMGRLDRITEAVVELSRLECTEELTDADRWLMSRASSRMSRLQESMRSFDLRSLANEVYFEMYNDIRWYSRRGGCNGAVAGKVLEMWVRSMTPVTPHLAEELWEGIGGNGLVSQAEFPRPSPGDVEQSAEEAEECLRRVIADTNEILKVTGIKPKSIYLYTSPSWKQKIAAKGLELAAKKQLAVPALTKAAMADEELRKRGKEVADFARKFAEDLMKRSQQELERLRVDFDERAYLKSASSYLASEFGCDVLVFGADEPDIVDPQRKSRSAQPRRPAIYIE
ncbi:MAG TPA: leucine--tRNA ligase [Methanomassiliicoccales archaeon]|nr:leucine--tRNA ligase [Methanomassiliicoccales archaeon]